MSDLYCDVSNKNTFQNVRFIRMSNLLIILKFGKIAYITTRKVVQMTTLVLMPLNRYYLTDYTQFTHCDEIQYRHYCEKHFEAQGCYYCEFDPYAPCECDQ
jgi:hypothetical protein